MARVEIRGVSKVYPGGVRGVGPLDLTVDDGELVVLLGASGSGKTTILRLIAGLERATTGTIAIGGREVTKLPPRSRQVAYVPQSCPLYPHLVVFENLAFAERVRHGSILTQCWSHFVRPSRQGETAERVRQVAERLGIGHLLERWPRQLSGGERQRVALGRALVRDPAVFLFDEPLSSVDVKLRLELRADVKKQMKAAGKATVYVTHDESEAEFLADRIVRLEEGRIV
jgi:multiple sugar transport system ATP-binding protein